MNRQTVFVSTHSKKSFYIKIFFILYFVSLFFYAKIDGKTASIRTEKQPLSQELFQFSQALQFLQVSQGQTMIEKINWNGQDANPMEIKISVQSLTSIARIRCELYCVKEEGETITRRNFWQEESPQQKHGDKYKNTFYFQPFGSVTIRAWAIEETGKKLGVTEQTVIGESAVQTMIGEAETRIDGEREKILENPQNDTTDEVRETNTQSNINDTIDEQIKITTETMTEAATKTTTQTMPKSSKAAAVSSTSNFLTGKETKNSESIQKHEEKISDKEIEKEISNRVREEVKKQLQEKNKNEKIEEKENDIKSISKTAERSVGRICYFLSILLFIIILGKEFFCI